MKIQKKVEDAFNAQIAHEFEAKMLYLSMSAYFEQKNLKGFANWFRKQANEEDAHAMKIFDFIHDRDGSASIGSIEKPKSVFKSAVEVAQMALGHERKVTELIGKLVELSEKENDHASRVFLQWFVSEQVEEEEQAQWLCDQLEMAADSKSALLILDRELAARKE